MKKVAVYFSAKGAMDYPFTSEGYLRTYFKLSEKIQEKGGEFYIVRGEDTYLGNGKFSQSWQFINGELVESGEVKVDMIYDKGTDPKHFLVLEEDFPVLNPKYINDVCTDKYKTYEIFGELCPKTFQVKNEEELQRALINIPSEKKVIKPIDSEEGKGVFIGSEQYILHECPHDFPLLAQEFLDSSSGIPGLVEGLHDFRIVMVNGEIVFSFLRTPPEGQYKANVAQGGGLKFIYSDHIPEIFVNIAKKVDEHFANYPKRFLGVDFALTQSGPKIIELNSRVGLPYKNPPEELEKFLDKLAELLLAD